MGNRSEESELRKEMFDYLRQLQKQEEQSAKVSGMSSWVLVAAMCYLGAWLLDHAAKFATQQTFIIGLSFALCFVFLRLLITPRRPKFLNVGTRLSQFVDEDSSMIGLNACLIGLSPVIPTLASYLLLGWSYAVICGSISSTILIVIYVLGPVFKQFYPKQHFRTLIPTNKLGELLMQLLTLVGFILHLMQLFNAALTFSNEQLVFAGHVVALWWVLLQLTHTINSAATLKKYAHLEEALMFGVATPSEILKKLELQAFGPSLERELEDLGEDIVATDSIYSAAKETFDEVLKNANEVPHEYKHEISGRLRTAFVPLSNATIKLLEAIEEKVDYLNSLQGAKSSNLDPTIKQLIQRETEQLKNKNTKMKAEAAFIKQKFDVII